MMSVMMGEGRGVTLEAEEVIGGALILKTSINMGLMRARKD